MRPLRIIASLQERAARAGASVRDRWNSIDRARLSVTLFLVFVLFTSAALIVPILPASYLSWYEAELRDQIARTQAKIRGLEPGLAMYQELQDTNRRIAALTSVVGQVEKQRMLPLRFYREFVKKIDEDLWFRSIRYKQGVITIDLLAPDKQTVERYVGKLGRTRKISDVRADNIQQLDLPSFKGCSAQITFRWSAE